MIYQKKKKPKEHKKMPSSRDGGGDKNSETQTGIICLSSLADLPPIKPNRLDFGPITTSIIPPIDMGGKDLTDSSSSERVEIDQSRCDTISEVEEIEEEISVNSSMSDSGDNIFYNVDLREKELEYLAAKERSLKMAGRLSKESTLDSIDKAVEKIVKLLPNDNEVKQIKEFKANKELSENSKSVRNESLAAQKEMSNIIINDKDKVINVKPQSNVQIQVDSSPSSSESVLIGGQQLDKDEFRSIFQELERGLGKKIESIYVPEESPRKQESNEQIKVAIGGHITSSARNETTKECTKRANRESVDSRERAQKEQHGGERGNRGPRTNEDSGHVSRPKSNDTKTRRSPSKETKEKDKNETKTASSEYKSDSSSRKSLSRESRSSKSDTKDGKLDKNEKKGSDIDKFDTAHGRPQTVRVENNEQTMTSSKESSAASKKSVTSTSEKTKQQEIAEFDSFFKFGIDTSYEEFCRFKSEMLKRKGIHTMKIENESTNSGSTGSTFSKIDNKIKSEEKAIQKEEETTIDASTTEQKSTVSKTTPSSKIIQSSKKKAKLGIRESSSGKTSKEDSSEVTSHRTKTRSDRTVKSDKEQTESVDQAHEERTQDISVSTATVSGVGDYMEPISLASIGYNY